MRCQSATYFADKNALKGTLTETLKEVQPTLFFGVPRVWEKIQEKMVAIGKDFYHFIFIIFCILITYNGQIT